MQPNSQIRFRSRRKTENYGMKTESTQVRPLKRTYSSDDEREVLEMAMASMTRNRKKVLEKKKVVGELIRKASAQIDPIATFDSLRRYNRNGLSVYLESGRGDKLSSPMKQYIQNLLKVNMEMAYGPQWPAEERLKRREMISSDARYIFVRETKNESANETSRKRRVEYRAAVVGFVQYRFTLEEEVPVLYVYEIQLQSRFQGKGLGEFLMHLIEFLASKNGMGAVMLTVQKSNLLAMRFYMNKLRYKISSISPSKMFRQTAAENYEILCKAFDSEAKSVLEITEPWLE